MNLKDLLVAKAVRLLGRPLTQRERINLIKRLDAQRISIDSLITKTVKDYLTKEGLDA